MQVTAFVGSARKKHTYHAAEFLLTQLQALGEVDYEVTALSDYHLEPCIGCKLCFDKGEDRCPLQDDRDVLIAKMVASDGVVFASPTYAFQVSGLMKTFLDRIGFILHRPRFFGKTCTSIAVQGIYGGQDVVKYLDFVGGGLGFNPVKGSCVTALVPMSAKDQEKSERTLVRHSQRFYRCLLKSAYPSPSLFRLMAFRMSRTSMKRMLNDDHRDYAYYKEQGWLESDYYYPVRLGMLKKLAGTLFDALGVITASQ